MTLDLAIVRHPRARRAKLSVDRATGEVRLTLPPRAALKPALAWAEAHRGWIDRQRATLPTAVPFVPDAEIPFRGHPIRIEWRSDAPRSPVLEDGVLICGGPEAALARRAERWLRAAAQATLLADTLAFAGRAGVTIGQVSVADARRRWGSCSSSGAIRYNWRLILAPDWVRRATVAHEVAHRVHMNHSPDFHALVAHLLDADPAPAMLWLRTHGSGLYRIGR